MKFKGIIALGITLLFCQMNTWATSLVPPKINKIDTPARILFVGNSFSFYNNGIHNQLGALLRSANKWQAGKSYLRLSTLSGGALHEHQLDLDYQLNSAKKPYHAVVLQGHSKEAIDPKKHKAFKTALNQLSQQIRRANAQPILFMTWGYAGDDKMSDQLANAYIEAANELDMLVVPVGLAFIQAQKAFPQINLYIQDVLGVNVQGELSYRSDIKHPSQAGSYLAACVFYASLFHESPEGLVYRADLSTETAEKLQKLAWQVVQDFYR
ncbi:MAG: hypothetical protein ACI88A_001475 [Paraglaciecola sp.]|jgi:hypothetical protein